MKKIFSTLIFLLVTQLLIAQSSVTTSNKTVVWYGIDFSQAEFIGKEGFKDPKAIVDLYLAKWNDLIINESSKYNVAKYFRKDNVIYHLDPVTAVNEKVDPNKLVLSSSARPALTHEQIGNVVSQYKKTEEEKLGLVFIVDRFDKGKSRAWISVTFFNTKTNKVLFTKQMNSMASGFGLRNFWAKPVYNIMKRCKYELKPQL